MYPPSLKIAHIDLHYDDCIEAYKQWLDYNHSKIIISMWVGNSAWGSMFVFPGHWLPHESMEYLKTMCLENQMETTQNINLTIVMNSLAEQEFLQEALHSLLTLFPNIHTLQLWVHDPNLLAVSPVLPMFLDCWMFCWCHWPESRWRIIGFVSVKAT